MPEYLTEFNRKLKPFKGSMVRVSHVKAIEPNAKEYLNKLAQEGSIERVKWGWYWIPSEVKDIWAFLKKDKNFKLVSAQTAASFWNNDFVHRDVYVLKVTDKSYGKALKEFGRKRGWSIEVEYAKDASRIRYRRVRGLFVEDIEMNVVECLQKWAFADAFATLHENKARIDLDRLIGESYWRRISKTSVRVKQALEYGFHQLAQKGGVVFPHREARLDDDYVRREIDEAIEKVVELG